jgi:hypothetical protein
MIELHREAIDAISREGSRVGSLSLQLKCMLRQ